MCSVKPVDEAARRIGLGEFLADVRAADDALVAFERLVHPGFDDRQTVVHEVAADLVARIGEAVRAGGRWPRGEAGGACRCRCRRGPRGRPPAAACTPVIRSIKTAPVARPSVVSICSTRALGTSRAPAAIAFGHKVSDTSWSAPVGQPLWQAPQLLQAGLPSNGWLRIALRHRPSGASRDGRGPCRRERPARHAPAAAW